MQSNSKTVAIFLIILGFIFAFSPIIAINNSFLTRNNNEFSEISDNEGTDQTDPYGMEGLATSSIPVVPVWSYDTSGGNRDIAISSNGQYIAVACGNFNLYLFEKDNSTPLQSYNAGNDIQSVAITPDGQYIVAGGYDEKVYLFSKNSSTPLWSYEVMNSIKSVVISSDGQYFAAGISTGTNGVFPVYLFHLAVSPHIEVNSPDSNQPFRLNAPFFSINIYNLSPINETWYTIDGGTTNYTFSGLSGFINQTAWDNEEEGVLTIKFYANDSLGHVGFKDIQVSKNPPKIDMFIPGYNLIFLLGILSFVSLILVKNLKNLNYKT